jgi:hypothetical protein
VGRQSGCESQRVAGAAIAALLAELGNAPYPAQLIVTAAASCAFLAVLIRPTKSSPSDWFTVRALLALNLIVFGISYGHRLHLAIAATTIVLGLSLLTTTNRTELAARGRHRRKR